MSTKSREFWEDYEKHNFMLDMPDVLDRYAAMKDAKIAELMDQVTQLEVIRDESRAENKRLREGIEAVIDQGYKEVQAIGCISDQLVFVTLSSLLPPAPVTEWDDYQKEDQFIFSLGERLKAIHQGFEGCSDQWYRVARSAIELYKNKD